MPSARYSTSEQESRWDPPSEPPVRWAFRNANSAPSTGWTQVIRCARGHGHHSHRGLDCRVLQILNVQSMGSRRETDHKGMTHLLVDSLGDGKRQVRLGDGYPIHAQCHVGDSTFAAHAHAGHRHVFARSDLSPIYGFQESQPSPWEFSFHPSVTGDDGTLRKFPRHPENHPNAVNTQGARRLGVQSR